MRINEEKFICIDKKAECSGLNYWDTKKGCVLKDTEDTCLADNSQSSRNAFRFQWKENDFGGGVCVDLKANCNGMSIWLNEEGCVPKDNERYCIWENQKGQAPLFEWKKLENGSFSCINLKAGCGAEKKWDIKKGCVDKPKEQTKEEACLSGNSGIKGVAYIFEWIKKEDGSGMCVNHKENCKENQRWDNADGCIDTKEQEKCSVDKDGRPLSKTEIADCKGKNSGSKDINEVSEINNKGEDEENKRVPSRFVPINIPTRQIYILPGMP